MQNYATSMKSCDLTCQLYSNLFFDDHSLTQLEFGSLMALEERFPLLFQTNMEFKDYSSHDVEEMHTCKTRALQAVWHVLFRERRLWAFTQRVFGSNGMLAPL